MSTSRTFPGDLSPYWLEATFEIRQVLKVLAKRAEKISVYPTGAEPFMAVVLDVTDRGELVLDAPPNPKTTASCLGGGVRVHAVLDKVDIDFAVSNGRSINYDGSPALAFPSPTRLHKLQRREYFRMPTPMSKPLMCSLWVEEEEEGKRVEHQAQVLDISLGGVCVQQPPKLELTPGFIFRGCSLVLPDGTLKLDLTIKHVFDVENRLGKTSRRAGCEFVELSNANQQAIQKFMTKLERDRRSALA